ncbi:APC family permease [Sulfoacidibacillus ferrooxidans]|nr:APC family permease [Sulfoacidibacillus ferrooxidans]
MNLLDLTMASVSGVIGSGWLLAAITSSTYAGPAAIISWIIGGVFMLILALPFIELSSAIPESGSLARYPHYSHGSFTSLLMGWGLFLSYAVVPATEAEAAVQYANGYLPGLYSNNGTLTGIGILIASVLLIVFFVINYFGVRLFAKVNTTVTILKVIIPLGTALLFIFSAFHPGNFSEVSKGGFMPYGFQGVLAAVSLGGIAFSYEGFRQAIDLAGEGRNPQKNIPRAVIISLVLSMVIYLLLQVAFIGALTAGDLAHGWAKLNLSSPFADLALSLNMGWLAIILYADASYSPAGSGLVYTASAARVLWAIPKNGYGPKWLSHVSSKYLVPTSALWVGLVISFLCLLPFPAWSELIGINTSFGVITYMMGPSSALVLRKTAPNLRRLIKIKGLNWIGLIGFIFGGLIIYWTSWPSVGYVGLALFVGFLLFLYYYRKNHLPTRDIKAGLWFVAMMITMVLISYLGSFGGIGWIQYPWDIVVVAVVCVFFYFWSVRSGYETEAIINLVASMEEHNLTLDPSSISDKHDFNQSF